jgi:hypothetical protein
MESVYMLTIKEGQAMGQVLHNCATTTHAVRAALSGQEVGSGAHGRGWAALFGSSSLDCPHRQSVARLPGSVFPFPPLMTDKGVFRAGIMSTFLFNAAASKSTLTDIDKCSPRTIALETAPVPV